MMYSRLFLRGIHLNISFGQKQTGSCRDGPPVDCGDGRLCKDTNIFADGLFSCEKTNTVGCCYGEWAWVKERWQSKELGVSLLQGWEDEHETQA